MSDKHLLAQIEAFLERHSVAPSRFGRAAMGDAGLVTHLRNGRSLSLKNAKRVLTFIEEYQQSAPSPSERIASEADAVAAERDTREAAAARP